MRTLVFGIFFFFIIFFSSLYSPCLSELCHPNEKKCLLQIKKSLNNPQDLSSWTPKSDCCTGWAGVKCAARNGRNRITSLTISTMEGPPTELFPEIGEFVFLQYLELQIFNLTGTIPHFITKLKNLQELDISLSKMSGPIPMYISELKSLKTLYLFGSSFSGPVPGFLSLMPNLKVLSLNYNKFTSIEESFGSAGCKLKEFYLESNRLSGTIPHSLSHCNFDSINLSRNKLMGDASMIFGANKTTESVELSENKLEFDLSNVKFSRKLNFLYMGHNQIFGKVPEDMTNLPDLKFLNLEFNRLCGKIPVGGNLQSIEPRWFSHNRCLCGAPLHKRCK